MFTVNCFKADGTPIHDVNGINGIYDYHPEVIKQGEMEVRIAKRAKEKGYTDTVTIKNTYTQKLLATLNFGEPYTISTNAEGEEILLDNDDIRFLIGKALQDDLREKFEVEYANEAVLNYAIDKHVKLLSVGHTLTDIIEEIHRI